jgi:hypothetical protein
VDIGVFVVQIVLIEGQRKEGKTQVYFFVVKRKFIDPHCGSHLPGEYVYKVFGEITQAYQMDKFGPLRLK